MTQGSASTHSYDLPDIILEGSGVSTSSFPSCCFTLSESVPRIFRRVQRDPTEPNLIVSTTVGLPSRYWSPLGPGVD